jgi:hypothetical protein
MHRRRYASSQHASNTGIFDKRTTIHVCLQVFVESKGSYPAIGKSRFELCKL